MSMDIESARTAALFIDFQVDVCGEGGLMVSDDPEVLLRFRAARENAGRILRTIRSVRRTSPVFVRHAFASGYPELEDVRAVGMEQYVKSQGAFRDGAPGAEWVPELTPGEGEQVFTKTTISAFAGTTLDRWLRRRGIDCVMISGVVTHYAVLAATLSAYDLGYRTIVISDACASADPSRHDMALDILRPLADVVSSEDVVTSLAS